MLETNLHNLILWPLSFCMYTASYHRTVLSFLRYSAREWIQDLRWVLIIYAQLHYKLHLSLYHFNNLWMLTIFFNWDDIRLVIAVLIFLSLLVFPQFWASHLISIKYIALWTAQYGLKIKLQGSNFLILILNLWNIFHHAVQFKFLAILCIIVVLTGKGKLISSEINLFFCINAIGTEHFYCAQF